MQDEDTKEVVQAIKQSRKQTSKPTELYSKRLKDGTIIEAVYDAIKEETAFLVFRNGEISRKYKLEINGKEYIPPKPTNTLLSRKFVKLASGAMLYESESKLFQCIKAFIHKYLQISEEFENIASYYVLLTWVYDEFRELPYLRALGDLGTGKSRFLFVIGSLCYKGISLTGSSSVAAIFRIIDAVQGTIILDEADFQYSDTTSEIVKILNSGFQKGTPVLRAEGTPGNNKSFDPIAFDVFCPKIIATRKNFQDMALESRCLTETMETMSREDIPENLEEGFEEEALALRNQLLSFRFRKLAKGIRKKSIPVEGIEPRLRQIIIPIYSIVDEKEQQENILHFIRQKQKALQEERYNSFEGEVFRIYIKMLEETNEPPLKDIAEKYEGKYSITAQKVGNLMKSIFHLETNRKNTGTVVKESEHNEKQRQKLMKKYGLLESEVNTVNTVNTPQDEPGTIEDFETIFDAKAMPIDLKDSSDS